MAERLSVESQLKLELMRAINADLDRRFRTLSDAADYAGVDCLRLSRVRKLRHEYFSLNWLLRLAQSAKVRMRITVN